MAAESQINYTWHVVFKTEGQSVQNRSREAVACLHGAALLVAAGLYRGLIQK